jgi:vacuolar-type H+-ATPase subunit I/STV1
MAKPINIKEHNSAFTKFLLFFLVTLIMAVSAVYFNFKVPNKELAILRERSELLRNQQINQENYKRTLNEVIQVFNKLDSSTSKAMVESELSDKLNALRNAASIEDSTASQKLNQMVFGLVNEYRNAKFKLFDLKDFEQEIRKKNDKIQELSTDLDDCRGRANFNKIP